ncbi:MAG: nickel pincer cofactor biosynthesis protein LarC [Chitinivibrionia bacterium]|nr:nickel pincer cofactor biosynthesis protein LarC [Chitinivibrionia bacterium]
MKTLYIECNMGAAGDMLMAALSQLCPEVDKFIEKMNEIGLKNTVVNFVKTEKCGICGASIDVIINGETEENCKREHHREHDEKHEHHHSSIDNILSLIRSLNVPENVKNKSIEVYRLLASAEAQVHGKEISHIHFHELGTLDAICDIVGCCLALDIISPEKIIVSPICTGFGSVKCQHGILPVPAPATAHILKEIPIYGGDIKGELCTPTGAALLKTFAHSFGSMPVMNIEKTSYGMGKKDFERLNCVRAFLGESEEKSSENVYEISCNLDDITAEELAFSYDLLFEAGALDVFVTPTVMKKGRLSQILTALFYEKDKTAVAKAMLMHTTTRGVRISSHARMTLESRIEEVQTKYGNIKIKVSSGYGITKIKPEYESVAAAAKKFGVTFAEVQKIAMGSLKNAN